MSDFHAAHTAVFAMDHTLEEQKARLQAIYDRALAEDDIQTAFRIGRSFGKMDKLFARMSVQKGTMTQVEYDASIFGIPEDRHWAKAFLDAQNRAADMNITVTPVEGYEFARVVNYDGKVFRPRVRITTTEKWNEKWDCDYFEALACGFGSES